MLLRLTFVLCWVLVLSVSTAAQKYAIRLNQLEKAGSRYHLSASSNEATTVKVSVGDRVVKNNSEAFAVELTADVVVLETNVTGWATRKSLTIRTSSLRQGDSTRPLFPPGTVVVASIQNGDTVYRVDNKTVDDATTKALRAVASLHDPGFDDDDLFGTKIPRSVGESWATNREAVAQMLKSLGVEVRNAKMEGNSKIEKLENNHLYIHSSMYVSDVSMLLPPGFKADSGEMRGEFSWRLPKKQTDIDRAQKDKMMIRVVGTGVLGDQREEAKLYLDSETSGQWEVTPIAKSK